MDDQRAQIIEKIKASNNFLVTVSNSPTVDQLAAAIGLTLLLGKLNKQATAVFSGEVPSAIRFLRPDKTLQKSPDNLQDFIISLDKAKADKLRYKVEDDVVRIFITPYKTSLSSKDLTYSKGDFNVDLVLALGVARKDDLDTAIAAHGRILHDATVISITNTDHAQLGTLHLEDTGVSGLSELVYGLVRDLGNELLDERVATALLTGMVAATEHFGNDKTTPMTLTASASLLEAGANQQLVATELGGQKDRGGNRPGQNPPSQQLKSYKQIAREQGKDRQVQSDKPAGGQAPARDGNAGPTKDLPAVVAEPAHQAPKPLQTPIQTPTPLQSPAVTPTPVAPTHAPVPPSDSDQPAPKKDTSIIEVPPPPERPPVSDLGITTPAPIPTPTPMMDTSKTLADLETEVKGPHSTDNAIENSTDVDSARKAVESALGASDGPAPQLDIAPPAAEPDLPDFLKTPSMTAAPQPPVVPAGPPPFTPPMPATLPQQSPPIAPPPVAPSLSATPMPPAPIGVSDQPKPQPHNPAANEKAPLSMSPADQPFTMPLPPPPAASQTIESDELPPALQNGNASSPPPGPPPMPPIPPSMPPAGPGISHH